MRVAVAGSGPSGVAAATVLLERGFQVDMLDGGVEPEAASQEFAADLAARLKAGETPSASDRRFLSRGAHARPNGIAWRQAVDLVLRGRIAPDALQKRVLGSTFAFAAPTDEPALEGAWLPRSLAVGGLANVWGTACYPLRAEDYADWPLTVADLAPWYARATGFLGVWGEADALAAAYPVSGQLVPVAGATRDLDSPLEAVLVHWRRHKAALRRHALIGGRARLAVTPPGTDARACLRCGFCLSGCPAGAMWHAQTAIAALAADPRFRHLPGRRLRRFAETEAGVRLEVDGVPDAQPYDALFLAAGPLGSLGIVAGSLQMDGAVVPLRENDMFVLPFKLPHAHATRRADAPRFALHEAVLAFEPGSVAGRAAHLQLYQVTEPLLGPLGPLVAALPESIGVRLRRWLSGYVIGFFYLHSDDSRAMTIHLRQRQSRPVLSVRAPSAPAGGHAAKRAVVLLRRAVAETGLMPVGALMRAGPPGFSGHIGCTLPMRRQPKLHECDPAGRLFGHRRVMVVDAGAFPAMPAQNPTLTIAANAMRIADRFAQRQSGR